MSTLDNPIIEHNDETSPWTIAMRYGGIIAAIMIVITLVQYLTGLSDPANAQSPASMVIGLISFAVWIGGVVMAVRAYRTELGGFMSFGEGFRVAFFTFLVISVISGVWNFIFYSFIATDFLENMLEFVQYTMEDAGAPEDSIDMMMGVYGRMYTPTGMTLMTLVGGAIFGAIVSLIIGAAMKKDAPAN
jgi:tryptophan-rich sensory protein